MKTKLAVLSDLHCHPRRDRENSSHLLSDAPRVPTHNHPIEALRTLIANEGISAEYLVLPGDFTDQADLHGYIVGVHCAQEVARALGVKCVIATLGNHDVDSRQKHGKDPFFLGGKLFSDFPVSDRSQRSRFFDPNYGFAFIEDSGVRLLVLNSVVSHRTIDESSSGCFTDVQLENLKQALREKPKQELQICVFHHHPLPHEDMELGAGDLMIGGEALVACLEEAGFHLVIHGHKHHPRLRYSQSGLGAGIPVFASGSFSAVITGKLVRSLRNTFHIVELETATSAIQYSHGTVRSWELSTADGWIATGVKQSGFPHVAGFGCRRPVEQLVPDVIAAVNAQAVVPWGDLERINPDFSYLSPTDRRRLAEQVATNAICYETVDPQFFSRVKAVTS